jgi:Tol biopolymer transport system component
MNLTSGGFTGENLFMRDLLSGTTYPLTRSGVYFVTQTSDGHFVTYIDMNGTGSGKLYVWDARAASVVYTNGSLGISAGAVSPDGTRLVYWAGSGISSLFATDLAVNTSWTIVSNSFPGPHKELRFDRSGGELAYTTTSNGVTQVYVYNFQTGSNCLVSRGYNSLAPGDGPSDSPEISADGRFIAYRSAAANIVPDDTNAVPDVFVYDVISGGNSLMSVNLSGSFPNNRSLVPAFSADGRTLCFQSWATDLAPDDFNQASDVFLYTLFYADIASGKSSSDGIWVSWPASAGQNARVQFKDALPETEWQELSGSVTNFGNRAYLLDSNPKAQRFYRIRTF